MWDDTIDNSANIRQLYVLYLCTVLDGGKFMNAESFKKALGTRIKQLRKNGKLSLADLSRHLPSISRANLGRIENGEVMPSAIFIYEISSFFNVSADWLLTGNTPALPIYLNAEHERLIEMFNLMNGTEQQILMANAAFLLSTDYSKLAKQPLHKSKPIDLESTHFNEAE
ncbi:hypothetical protein DSY3383 [Desulfitobacterium hafniense Y51]|uniref:HTH cro/C1-type domain-containing protein n=1 Tax=Desulfitobacterium hafniense (strain Y51) TaxID=138119 RepID=Q24S20_DESHY|nr:hypothetical protein DSY3383 [Desulfitobacterium hafniense Y51]